MLRIWILLIRILALKQVKMADTDLKKVKYRMYYKNCVAKKRNRIIETGTTATNSATVPVKVLFT
jgi:hypothetical protein